MEISCIDEREEKAEDNRQDLVASGWFVNPSTSEKKSTSDLLADYVFSGDVSF